MSPVQIGIGGIVVLTLLILARVPLAVAMGLVGFFGYAAIGGFDSAIYLLSLTPESLVNHSFSILPLFVLMGTVAAASGMSESIFAAANGLAAGRRGGLAIATIGGCAGFSSICGSSIATAGTFSKICIPQMRNHGYDIRIAAGSVAAGGTLGILIPPSGLMVIYALAAQESVPALFAAGMIPGLLLTALFIGVIVVLARLRPDWMPRSPAVPWGRRLVLLSRTWKIVLLFSIAVGGIYSGWFSPTEAAGMAAFTAVVISFSTRTLTLRSFYECVVESLMVTSMLMFVIVGAWFFSYFIALARIPTSLVDVVNGYDLSPVTVMVLILVFYILLGCLLDSVTIILVTTPVFLPLVAALGYDPIWYGIMMVIVVEMGLITPPVGLNVFVIKGQLPDIPISKIFTGIVPFLGAHVLLLGLLIAFPGIALWLPKLLYQ